MIKNKSRVGLMVSLALLVSCTQEPTDKVYALVNGQAITESQVLTPKVLAAINEIKRAQVDLLISEKVVALEAERLHTTGPELLGFFDRLKGRPIEPAEIKRFLISFESASKPGASPPANREIEKSIIEGRLEDARRRYVGELRARAAISLLWESSSKER